MIIKVQKKIRRNLYEAVKHEDLQDLNQGMENRGIPSDQNEPGEAGSPA